MRKILALFVLIVFLSAGYFSLKGIHNKQSPVNKNHQTAPAQVNPSINDPSSVWVVVDKGRILPSDYIPAGLATPSVPLRLTASSSEMKLRPDSGAALKSMFDGAAKDNLRLMLASGYRSYDDQKALYKYFSDSQGQAAADKSSARPGYSEHQAGLAADIEPVSRECEVQLCFGDLAEGKWLLANSYKYGFIVRYQKDKQSLTGYEYEPWHARYVGTNLAKKLFDSNKTMEQYFNLAAFRDYSTQPVKLKP